MTVSESRLRRLWSLIPSGYCKGRCAASCNGPVDTSPLERDLLARHGVAIPYPGTPDEWERARNASDYRCPALDVEGRCVAYDDRPTACRIWGGSEATPCPYGCIPAGGRWPRERALVTLVRAAVAGGAMSADEGQELIAYMRTNEGARAVAMLVARSRQLAARIARQP